MTITPPGPLDYERHVIRRALKLVMTPGRDLETLCKLVSLLANSAATVLRAEAAFMSTKQPNHQVDAVSKALADLMAERADEEETQW